MDIVNYIRTLADKLGEQNKPSTDYSDTEKKIAEITGGVAADAFPPIPSRSNAKLTSASSTRRRPTRK
ncbi:MAG: hypothetical protein ACLUSP_07370 [Christensenellales bacterium]